MIQDRLAWLPLKTRTFIGSPLTPEQITRDLNAFLEEEGVRPLIIYPMGPINEKATGQTVIYQQVPPETFPEANAIFGNVIPFPTEENVVEGCAINPYKEAENGGGSA